LHKPLLTTQQRPLYGILLILTSCVLFSSQDGISKYLTLFYSPILVVWMRFVIQVALTAAVFVPRMGVSILHTKQPKLQLARGVCMLTASVSFVIGLLYVPIGEATAVVFLSPILLTGFAGYFLKEKIKLGQWIAVGSGLLGVLVIVRPGSALFTPAMLLPLIGAFSMSIFQLLTRRLLVTDHIVSTNFLTGLFCTCVMSCLVWYFWQTPTLADFMLMLIGGAIATIGHLLLTYSYRHGSVVMLAPFSYSQIVFSSFVAFLFFGHVPDDLTMVGMLIIILSGAGLVWWQRR
jgi:drug/metabolite transporter (DMT)-like permease